MEGMEVRDTALGKVLCAASGCVAGSCLFEDPASPRSSFLQSVSKLKVDKGMQTLEL